VADLDQLFYLGIRLAAVALSGERQERRAQLGEVEGRGNDVEILFVEAGPLGDMVPQRIFELRKFEDEARPISR